MFRQSVVLTIISCVMLPTYSPAKNEHSIRESTIVYKLKNDVTPQQLKSFNSLVHKNNIITQRSLKGVGVNVVKLKNIRGIERAFSQNLVATGAVKFAEPDVSIPHAIAPDDDFYSLQWHHPVIASPEAWDVTVGLPDIKVCVLDTGVDSDHPDLINNLLSGWNTAETTLDVSGDEIQNPYYHTTNVEAILGHGTGTAGTIGAVGNNNIGVTGVAWDIGIVPVKINFDDIESYAYYSAMIEGIEWCADQGVKVANLSYGGAQYSGIEEAAQYLRDKGGLLFMSAGNDYAYNDLDSYPDYSSFIVVGATDNSNIKTDFSNSGPYIDVVAPGEDIATTGLDGDYFYMSGTSFSSPIVAGIAGLIYSLDPNFTPSEVESFIIGTTTDIGAPGDDDVYGHGLVNAGASILAAYNPTPNTPPVAISSATPIFGTAPLTVEFGGNQSYDSDGSITSYSWDFGDSTTGTGEITFHTFSDAGSFEVNLTVTDDKGATGTTSNPIRIQVEAPLYVLSTPTSLSASVDGGLVTLNWVDNSDGEEGYYVDRAMKIRGKYKFERIATIDPGIDSYVDEGLELGSYKYRVQSFYGSEVSDYSTEVGVQVETATLPPDPTTLVAPDLAVSISGNDVLLSWQYDCSSVSGCTYTIEKGEKVRGAINFSVLNEISGGTTYSDSGLASGTYSYRVNASADGTSSEYSNTVTARIK